MNAEERELRALTDQAFDLRETPYLRDAVEAIVGWFDRRYLRRYEHELSELAWLESLDGRR